MCMDTVAALPHAHIDSLSIIILFHSYVLIEPNESRICFNVFLRQVNEFNWQTWSVDILTNYIRNKLTLKNNEHL